MRPFKETIKRFCDDRGNFSNIDFNGQEAKRAYVITNNQQGVIRAFHGHKNEAKAFYVTKGAFMFNFHSMDSEDKEYHVVLDEHTPSYIFCPAGWYNGFVSLTNDAQLVVLSSSSMDESRNDDYRLDPMVYGEDIWQIVNR
jgi:dTDP-4-dehydrorhamnose 3,5-epimerase-like enzyme